jgi:hypothetical protein
MFIQEKVISQRILLLSKIRTYLRGEEMKKFSILVFIILFLICSTSIFALSSEYSNYDVNEFKYSNTAIMFSIDFNDKWDLYCSFDTIPEEFQAALQEIDPENFLYFGLTKNQMYGCRGMVEEVDMDLNEYCKVITEVNADAIDSVKTKKVKINNIPMIYLTYETKENNMAFGEYMFKKDIYNVRLTFWTLKSLFKNYFKEVDVIIKTFTEEE